jgi:hypothetical protein
MTSPEEWNALFADDRLKSLQLTEQDNEHMRSVLEQIPPCPQHGFCLQWFTHWIWLQKDAELLRSNLVQQPNDMEILIRGQLDKVNERIGLMMTCRESYKLLLKHIKEKT